MLAKHQELPKFYAPSKVLTLGAEKVLTKCERKVEIFAEICVESPADMRPRRHRVDRTNFRGGKYKKFFCQECWGPRYLTDQSLGELPKVRAASKALTLVAEKAAG
jgi:hypothetical protein